MSDWHAMMVSLMWNVQAWRDWLQQNIIHATSFTNVSHGKFYKQNVYAFLYFVMYWLFKQHFVPLENIADWPTFYKNTTKKAVQWHQYNVFSHALTVRLVLRYRDKQVCVFSLRFSASRILS